MGQRQGQGGAVMRILMVGGDGRGAFQMRAQQLGQAMGARVTTRPTRADWAWADLVVLVKHGAPVWGTYARKFTKAPVVWDVLDYWRQPDENQAPVATLRARVLDMAETIGARLIVGATEAMAQDLGGVFLPHHCRLGLAPTPPRDTDRIVVAYDGRSKYLGSWRRALETACLGLGTSFVVNPPDLSKVDVLVSLRGEQHDGEVCRRWKSGVKFVNALVAGRPIVSQSCAAQTEMALPGAVVASAGDLSAALQRAIEQRESAYVNALAHAHNYTLEAVAERYRSILEQTARRAA